MQRLGHLGFTLLLLSPFTSATGKEFIIFSAFFTLAPDIDIVLRVKHREYTHNLTFGVFLTALVSFILHESGFSWWIGFSAFTGVLMHILADLLTVQRFPPFFPFSRRKYALGLFKSDNAVVNASIFVLGVFSFIYFVFGGEDLWTYLRSM
jgi:inner membrane protein